MQTVATNITNSSGETRQNAYAWLGSATRFATACIIIADSPAVGIQKNAGVRPYSATITTIPVNHPASGVRTPHLELSADREKEPVEGYALKNVPTVLVTPIAISSWFGSILYPFTRPKAGMECQRQRRKIRGELTFRDGDMLQQEDDSGNGQLTS